MRARTILAIGVLGTIPLFIAFLRRGAERDAEPVPQPVRRSGGLVDAPGKLHKAPPPSRRGVKHSDQVIAKTMAAEAYRQRPRG